MMKLKKALPIDWRQYRSVMILMIVMIILAFLTKGTFVTPRNLTNLSRQVAINGILAVGMTYVILIGGIDLSIGSVVALSGVVAGVAQVNYGLGQSVFMSPWLGAGVSIFAAILVGTLCGLFNGILITRYRIAPFIITLGLMVIARGLSLIIAKGAAIAPLSDQFNLLGQAYLSIFWSVGLVVVFFIGALWVYFKIPNKGINEVLSMILATVVAIGAGWAFYGYRGIPVPVLVFGSIALVGAVILKKTRLGRFIYALGGNPEAAWLAGVPIRNITLGIYVVLGCLAGISGAILAARLNGALPTAGEMFELDAIAAVVIGGTSLLGGIGSVRGSIIGAFFIGALNNGMSLMDVTEFYQKVIKGVIIIFAVWIDTRQSK